MALSRQLNRELMLTAMMFDDCWANIAQRWRLLRVEHYCVELHKVDHCIIANEGNGEVDGRGWGGGWEGMGRWMGGDGEVDGRGWGGGGASIVMWNCCVQ